MGASIHYHIAIAPNADKKAATLSPVLAEAIAVQILKITWLKWSTKSGHRVKAVNCHGEVHDDNKETTDLYGRV